MVSGGDLSGTTLGDFELIDVLGRGGFGTVYRARQTALDREVAVKVLDPVLSRDERARFRFQREGRSAALLEHPNVVPVYAAGEDQGLAYLAMRLVRGESLEDRLRRGALSPQETVRIVDAVAAGLAVSHQANLIHRDIKPANILLEGHRVYLTDFGIAVVSEEAGRHTTGGIGTVDYISPEQAEGRDLGPPADLYSLACTAYHCLAGSPPFTRSAFLAVLLAHAREPVPPLGDPALDAFFARAMAKAPEDRWPDASSFAAAFRTAVPATATDTADGSESAGIGEVGWSGSGGVVGAGTGGSDAGPVEYGGSSGGSRRRGLIVASFGAVALAIVAVVLLTRSPDGGVDDTGDSAGVEATTDPATFTESDGAVEPSLSAAGSTEPGLEELLGTSARVAFEMDDGDGLDIWTAAPDGSNARRLTDFPGIDRQPAWSPDHDRLVYASSLGFGVDSDATSLYVVDADGGLPRRLTTGSSDRDPDWSPRGDLVVYHGQAEGRGVVDLFVVSPDGGEPRLLGGTDGNDTRPAFSGDGSRVFFSSNVNGSDDLFVIDIDDPEAEAQLVAGDTTVEEANPSSEGTLFTYNLRGQHIVLFDEDVEVPLPGPYRDQPWDNPDLAPGGRAMAAVDMTGEAPVVVVFPLNGSGARFTFPAGSLGPAW